MHNVCSSAPQRLGFKRPTSVNSCQVSTCFKANVEQHYELACHVKSRYDMESYGAYKHVDPRSAAGARAQEILGTVFHNGQRYDVGMLCADDNIQIPNSYFRHWYSSSISKSSSRETQKKNTLRLSVKTCKKVT